MGANARMARLKGQSKAVTSVTVAIRTPTTFTWTSGLNAILILDSSHNTVIGTSNNPSDITVTCDATEIEFHRTKTEIIAHCAAAAVGLYLPATVTVRGSESSHIIFLFPPSTP